MRPLCLFLCAMFNGIMWIPLSVHADTDSYWGSHAQGWHWYEIDSEPAASVTSTQSTPNVASIASTDPLEQLKAVQHRVDEAKAEAVLDPTPNNVERYITLQNALTQNARQFSQVWQSVIWQNPSLNFSLGHPTSQIGKEAFLDTERTQDVKQLKAIAQKYGLFFFFEGTCPYCQRFAPIVLELQRTYGFSVIPISLDGKSLPQYPEPRRDQGQATLFHVTRWPALFLVNPTTKQVIPITYGLISEDELIHRIVTLVTALQQQGAKAR